nr:hypothetical protein [Bradyrhizobium erythrophlei]
MAVQRHDAFRGKPFQCLADRPAAHAKIARQIRLDETLAGDQAAGVDAADNGVDDDVRKTRAFAFRSRIDSIGHAASGDDQSKTFCHPANTFALFPRTCSPYRGEMILWQTQYMHYCRTKLSVSNVRNSLAILL